MKSNANRFHDIGSLRELRKVRCVNDVAKELAAGRVKSGIDGAFSLGRLLLSFTQHYAPGNVKRIIAMILQMNQG